MDSVGFLPRSTYMYDEQNEKIFGEMTFVAFSEDGYDNHHFSYCVKLLTNETKTSNKLISPR